jgi:hypothetical protein
MLLHISLVDLVTFIIVFLVLETLAVCLYCARAGRSRWYAPAAGNLAGICLLLALGAVLTRASDAAVLLSLGGAFLAHVVDFRLRMLQGPEEFELPEVS